MASRCDWMVSVAAEVPEGSPTDDPWQGTRTSELQQ